MKKTIRKIASVIAAPLTFVGWLLCLLVTHAEDEYDPYK